MRCSVMLATPRRRAQPAALVQYAEHRRPQQAAPLHVSHYVAGLPMECGHHHITRYAIVGATQDNNYKPRYGACSESRTWALRAATKQRFYGGKDAPWWRRSDETGRW